MHRCCRGRIALAQTSKLTLALSTAAVLIAIAACTGDGADQNGGTQPTTSATATAPTDPRDIDLHSATITLPQWPGEPSRDECPAGSYTFRGGEAPAQEGWQYHISFLGEPRYADLDGIAGEEILTTIGCGPPSAEAAVAALALRPTADGNVDTMGYLQGDASFYASVTAVDVGDGVISLRTQQGLGPGQPQQHRTFRWQDGKFVQLTGPTADTRQ